ncbi:glycerol kinase GlpK [Mycolicibacterium wolinskyi]|uniref:glycerol kinase n=1 Tax=Mycolicibacterium wolinskyi TaxID=59750 RepID=A0A1X2EY63_9MYCO|nr:MULTISPECIES: glycerol kinase GlpK [Mycolicibacterium]MCV7285063.1 glycerol kinase GlpK [Mycolicibacterium wolinskyi]MCV7292187.1 glycerol kinase GlpK [Mycolicibacterium goodii]ORX11113.1 glycerol kinase [Mycolicibacterium wolinskyi]
MADYIGALDQGTSSTRFVIFDRGGTPMVMRQREHRQLLPGPGLVEHDATEIWHNTRQVISEALAAAGLTGTDLAALGVTNQRETAVAWNRSTGRPFGTALVWQDTRTATRMQQMAESDLATGIRHRTGLTPSAYFSASKFAWMLRTDETLASAVESGEALFGTIDSWLVWNLTGGPHGGVHATDVTNASRTMLMDLETLSWDRDLLELFGLPDNALPNIAASADPDGFGRTSASGPLGARVPIAAVLGDQQAALVGQACFDPGETKTTYGTGNFVLVNTGHDIVRTDGGLLSTVGYQLSGDKPVYALEGAVAYAGSTIQWLRDEIGIIATADDSERIARAVSDNGGVYLVPAFSGLFSPHWRPDARGVIVGLSRNSTSGHLVRAALESICFQTCDVLEAIETACGRNVTAMKVDGGVTVNELCMQMQADLLGVPVHRPAIPETTAVGAAYAAGLAVGIWPDTAALQAMWSAARTWTPEWSAQKRSGAMRQWSKAVERSLCWVEDAQRESRKVDTCIR